MASRKGAFIKKAIISSLFIAFFAAVLIWISVMSRSFSNQGGDLTKKQGFDSSELPVHNADSYVNKLIAESENYRMYLTGSNLSITVENKHTGAVIRSAIEQDSSGANKQWLGFISSGLVLNVIDGYNEAVQADLINNKNIINIEETDNGFSADVVFPDLGFAFQVSVRLENDDIVVEIPDASIKETIDKFRIGAINVFPMLGSTYLGEKKGYMFIPDGNGALIRLNDKEGRLSGGYSQLIYGDDIGFKDQSTPSLLKNAFQTVNDAEKILAPVFGMVHTDDKIGFLGIIESGAQRASIEAYPNGVKIAYNRIFPKFLFRKVFKQPTSNRNTGVVDDYEEQRTHYDIKVRYRLVSGDNADYVGLAVAFRNYLLDNHIVEKLDYEYNTRIDFIGVEREEWLLSTKNVTMTTVENIREIYNDLDEAGITDILSIYKGWQKGGVNRVPITRYKADKNIGGTDELTSLIKAINEKGRKMYLYHDVLRINPDEFNTTFNVVKRIDKRLYQEPTYMDVYENMLYLIPKRTEYYLNRLKKDYRKAGIYDLALAGITNSLFTYSYGGKEYSRTDTYNAYNSILANIGDEFSLLLEQPYMYLWKYTDAFLDMPVGTSQYNFTDEDVPFLAIALKGIMPLYSEYMNFEANKQEFFIQLIEMGIYPSFLITWEDSSNLIYTNSADIYSSKYSTYRDDIIEYTKALKEVNDAVKGAFIIDHERLGGVTVVTYDNGTKIYVNYSKTEQVVDGYTIEPLGYKVGE